MNEFFTSNIYSVIISLWITSIRTTHLCDNTFTNIIVFAVFCWVLHLGKDVNPVCNAQHISFLLYFISFYFFCFFLFFVCIRFFSFLKIKVFVSLNTCQKWTHHTYINDSIYKIHRSHRLIYCREITMTCAYDNNNLRSFEYVRSRSADTRREPWTRC